MTVVNHDARNQYVATNGQTIFNYTFEIAAAADIKLYQRAAGSTPNDTLDLKTYLTDYTLTGVGGNNGGTVVLVSGATTGDIITLQGNAPADRDTAFTPGGVIQAQNLNLEFDNGVLIYQTILAILNNLVPRYPESAVVQAFETILPNLTANKVWQMNDTGTAIIASTMVSGEVFASHASGQGASLIGLHPTGTVQDLANAPFILKTANTAAPNAQSLGALGSGVLKSATGSGVVSISAPLTSLDAVSSAADMMPYYTGVNTFGATTLTPFARTLLDDVAAVNARATLGLIIGTDVQAYNANLQSISALGTAANKMLYTTGVNTWAESDISPFTRTLLDDADANAWRTSLGVGPVAAALLIANNLSELTPTAATARANIDVPSNAEALLKVGGTMTGDLILAGPATIGTMPVTLAQAIALFQNEQIACVVMTEADLPTWIYDNGVLGVGATLTAPGNGASTFDGVIPTNGQRVFVNLQTTNPEWQGPYTIVQGTGGTPTVLTRATDWDTADEMQAGDIFSVVTGTTWGASQWMFSQTAAITVGTTDLDFMQIAGQGSLLKANNLSDLPNPATARTNLGLVIGTDVQAFNANLAAASLATASSTLVTNNAGLAAWSGAMTDGQVIIGVTGGTPIKATLSAGDSIQIVNAPGSITIKGGGSPTDSILLMGG